MPFLARAALPAGVYHLARRIAPPAGARALSALQAVTEHWETVGHGEVRQLAFLSRSQYVAQFSRPCGKQATIRFGSGGIAPLTDGVSLACASRLAREPRIQAATYISVRDPGQGGTVVLATAVQSQEQARTCRAARDSPRPRPGSEHRTCVRWRT